MPPFSYDTSGLYCCLMPIGIFAVIYAVIYVIRLLMPAERFRKQDCLNCLGRKTGVIVHEKIRGRFDRVTSMDRGGRANFGRYESYEYTYKCEVCGHEWTTTGTRESD